MKRLPTMKQLQYLVALADTRHFGRAAERCHITQSTLSAGIRDLESVLGTAVAERSNRRVLITRVGMQVTERAKALLRDAEEVMAVARAGRAPMTGEMRLGVIPTIGPFLLPRILPALRERFPDLTIYLREEQTAPLLARLEDGEVDAALIALPYDTGDLDTDIIGEDEFLFACNRDHALAGAEEVSLEALEGEKLMLLEEGHCLRGHALDACGVGRCPGARAVRGQQPAYAGADGGGRDRRHAGAAARDRRAHHPGNGYLALAAWRARLARGRTGMAADGVEKRGPSTTGGRAARADRQGERSPSARAARAGRPRSGRLRSRNDLAANDGSRDERSPRAGPSILSIRPGIDDDDRAHPGR